ncbi:hypothetical protein ILUMI_09996 [Ignelater luminosus]|uniref:Pre-rRNA-processing protein RIX1 N-terminal domain-containing protein n=1 Tax=Ignelater luminosus TaxID=2038154 RepID=A0A8K0D198_IGNLU|nr:hypothetical protein ILUMI_09996 [Ignelater luminosus]
MEELNKTQALQKVINSYIEKQNDLQVSMLLKRILISQMREEENAKIIIAYTNKLLMKNTKRWDGLSILDKIIDHCSALLVDENADFWMNTCVNVGTKEQVTVVRFTILTKVIQSCSNVSDLNKSTFHNILPKVLDMCTSIRPTPILSSAALTCLKICMQTFPSACGPFKNKIESYLFKYFTCELHSAVIKKAGTAFNALQQIGGAGPDGITHKVNWTNQMNKLCATIHKLYDNFLPHAVDFESMNAPENVTPYEFPQIGSGDQNDTVSHMQVILLKNITIFIDSMLLGGFPVEKRFTISTLLSVIKKGLSTDLLGDYNKSINDEKQEAALYIHHVHLLRLLKSFIARSSQDLYILEPVITKLLLDCLQRAQRQPFENSDYKKTVYEVLTDWISDCKNIISRGYHKKLLVLILNDITPEKPSLILVLNYKRIVEKSEAAKALSKIKESTCTEALKCGVALFTHVALHIDDNITKRINDTLIQLSLDIQGKEIVYPYKNEQCQTYLYEMLVSILAQPLFCKSCIIQTVTNILIRGRQRSSYRDVRQVCHRGLGLLGKICQPVCPTLNISQQADDDYSSTRRKRRRTSEISDVDDIDFLETTMLTDPNSQNYNRILNSQDDDRILNSQDNDSILNPQDNNHILNSQEHHTSGPQQYSPETSNQLRSSDNVRILDVQIIRINNNADIVDTGDVKMEIETDTENISKELISPTTIESESIEENDETNSQQDLEHQIEINDIKVEIATPSKNSGDDEDNMDQLEKLLDSFKDEVNANYNN